MNSNPQSFLSSTIAIIILLGLLLILIILFSIWLCYTQYLVKKPELLEKLGKITNVFLDGAPICVLFVVIISLLLEIISFYTIYTKETSGWNEQQKIGTIVGLSIFTVLWYLYFFYNLYFRTINDQPIFTSFTFVIIASLLSLIIFTVSYFIYLFYFENGSGFNGYEKAIIVLTIALDILLFLLTVYFIKNTPKAMKKYFGTLKTESQGNPSIDSLIQAENENRENLQ
jgi:hypothetical protein